MIGIAMWNSLLSTHYDQH